MTNRILEALPATEYRRLAPQLKFVSLSQGTILYDVGQQLRDIYFPIDCVVSCLSNTSDRETLEICIIGNEGVVGIPAVFAETTAFRGVVQLAGRAYTIERDLLRRELKRSESLYRLFMMYTNALLVQIAQTAVCNNFHSVEKRFCRWLLMAHDRSPGDEVPLTQEALARVLGSRRASVSVTASAFRRKGAIEYSRGVIRIRDRSALESASCQCYQAISAAHTVLS